MRLIVFDLCHQVLKSIQKKKSRNEGRKKQQFRVLRNVIPCSGTIDVIIERSRTIELAQSHSVHIYISWPESCEGEGISRDYFVSFPSQWFFPSVPSNVFIYISFFVVLKTMSSLRSGGEEGSLENIRFAECFTKVPELTSRPRRESPLSFRLALIHAVETRGLFGAQPRSKLRDAR